MANVNLSGMIGAKRFSILILLGLVITCAYAGDKPPVAANGDIVYKQTYKLHATLSDDEAFALIQNWFNADASKFTCQNNDGSGATCKNKLNIEDVFRNARPLQSLDPSSGRLMGKGLIKYFGNTGSAIGVLYMEYYVVLEVNGHNLTATVSNIKYHHYNPRTYADKPIYGWQGGRPLEAADKFENLVNNAEENKDIQDASAFVNKQISSLLGNLQFYLRSQKMADPSSLTASIPN